MKIYLDCCCLNRPFDKHNSPLILLEAEAVKVIISLCEKGTFTLVSSEILRYEINKIPDILKKEKIKILERLAGCLIKIDNKIENR